MDRRLHAFLAVARTGNLTAAADLIGLTQPALTKTIRRLEGDVGATLFSRSARGMRLTEVGELFLSHAQAIETHWEQAREGVHARSGGGLAEFHIASGPAYHMRIAPLLVRQLAREFPETRFIVDFDVAGTMLPRLIDGEIHLLLGAFIHEVPEGIVIDKLLDVVTGVMCCRRDPLATLDRVPPEALRDRRWVIYKRDLSVRQRLVNYCLRFQLPPPQVLMEVDALASSLMIVSGTPYLTAGPTTIAPLAEEAGLVVLPLEMPLWTFPSGAWTRRSTREYPILRRALEILRRLVASPDHSPGLSPEPE